MNNEMNRWQEFATEYAQLMNEQFQVMNKFWNASLEQTSGHTRKNVEMFFDHMNRNVEVMHEIYNNTVRTNEELKPIFQQNIEKFNARYQKLYQETIKNLTPKTMEAGK